MHDTTEAVTVTDDGRRLCRVSLGRGGPRRRHAFSVPHRRSGSSDENPLRLGGLVSPAPPATLPRPPRTHARPRHSHCYILQSAESKYGKATRRIPMFRSSPPPPPPLLPSSSSSSSRRPCRLASAASAAFRWKSDQRPSTLLTRHPASGSIPENSGATCPLRPFGVDTQRERQSPRAKKRPRLRKPPVRAGRLGWDAPPPRSSSHTVIAARDATLQLHRVCICLQHSNSTCLALYKYEYVRRYGAHDPLHRRAPARPHSRVRTGQRPEGSVYHAVGANQVEGGRSAEGWVTDPKERVTARPRQAESACRPGDSIPKYGKG